MDKVDTCYSLLPMKTSFINRFLLAAEQRDGHFGGNMNSTCMSYRKRCVSIYDRDFHGNTKMFMGRSSMKKVQVS